MTCIGYWISICALLNFFHLHPTNIVRVITIQNEIKTLGVKAGGDRQELHEAIRLHSMDAGKVVKGEGKSNDLLERIAKDPLFKVVHDKLDTLVDPKLFIGRANEQTDEFLEEEIDPVLEKEKSMLGKEVVDGVNV